MLTDRKVWKVHHSAEIHLSNLQSLTALLVVLRSGSAHSAGPNHLLQLVAIKHDQGFRSAVFRSLQCSAVLQSLQSQLDPSTRTLILGDLGCSQITVCTLLHSHKVHTIVNEERYVAALSWNMSLIGGTTLVPNALVIDWDMELQSASAVSQRAGSSKSSKRESPQSASVIPQHDDAPIGAPPLKRFKI